MAAVKYTEGHVTPCHTFRSVRAARRVWECPPLADYDDFHALLLQSWVLDLVRWRRDTEDRTWCGGFMKGVSTYRSERKTASSRALFAREHIVGKHPIRLDSSSILSLLVRSLLSLNWFWRFMSVGSSHGEASSSRSGPSFTYRGCRVQLSCKIQGCRR